MEQHTPCQSLIFYQVSSNNTVHDSSHCYLIRSLFSVNEVKYILCGDGVCTNNKILLKYYSYVSFSLILSPPFLPLVEARRGGGGYRSSSAQSLVFSTHSQLILELF